MDKIVVRYKKYRSRNRMFIWLVFVLLCLTGCIALVAGSRYIGLGEVMDWVRGEGGEMNRQILLHIRLPRILAAIITGIILSLSGAVMQILLRNPLASPYTLGISNAAAFGASCSIVFGGTVGLFHSGWLQVFHSYFTTVFAFLGSLCGLAIILLVLKIKRASVETIVLSGVIINSLFGAGIAVMQYLADSVQLASIVFWNFGDLGRGNWDKLLVMTVLLFPALVYLYFKRWDYKV
ncbi:MAG: iron ABC transporter permease, partial [Odoribacter sp.]|nr:iron ABC transporter permease [Odoribacter sp.]